MTRRSKRELESALENIESKDVERVGLITVLSTATRGGPVEPVPGSPDLVSIDGETHQLTENAREILLEGSP